MRRRFALGARLIWLARAAGRTEEPRYMELLIPHHYEKHLLRLPAADWPDPVKRSFQHLNRAIDVPLQRAERVGRQREARGLGAQRRPRGHPRAHARDRRAPRHDGPGPHAVDGRPVRKGRYLFCPNGSHMALYDDQQVSMAGLVRFIQDVDGGRF